MLGQQFSWLVHQLVSSCQLTACPCPGGDSQASSGLCGEPADPQYLLDACGPGQLLPPARLPSQDSVQDQRAGGLHCLQGQHV